MLYSTASGTAKSHFDGPINIKGFSFDMSTAPTLARTLTGAAAGDIVQWVTGIKFWSGSAGQPKLSTLNTIAYSVGTNLIKFSNAMSNMNVMGIWIDINA